jgi:protein arginine N-methyltransferase 1
MLQDTVRTTAFERAIAALVKPGMTVMDFGCGTGILSFFASRSGASDVIAIDQSAILAVAKVIGAANGFVNVRFIRGDESSVTLPAPVDVLVSECLGYFAVTEGMIDAFLLARERFLAPDGVLCPRELRFYAHLVSNQNLYKQLDFWGTQPYGIDYSLVRDWPFHTVSVKSFGSDDVLPWMIDLGSLDLRKASCQPSKFVGSCIATQTTEVYGLAGSFTAILSDDVLLDTGPFAERTHWGQVFFPLRHPFIARAGKQIEVQIEARRGMGEEMFWRWSINDGTVSIDMDDFVHRLWIQAQITP